VQSPRGILGAGEDFETLQPVMFGILDRLAAAI
jgi:hypothetical protein